MKILLLYSIYLTDGLLVYLVVTYFHLYGLLEDNKQNNTIQYYSSIPPGRLMNMVHT
jgi:hypothetical protein